MKLLILSILTLLAVGCTATSPDTANTQVFENSLTDSPAKFVIKIEPKHPTSAYEDGVEGYVVFDSIINENGVLEDIIIIESQPAGVFDQQALKALKFWRYKPAVINGKTVKVKLTERLDWKI